MRSEAATAVVEWLIDLGVAKVEAFIHPEHASSAVVASGAGLRASAERADSEIVWRWTAP